MPAHLENTLFKRIGTDIKNYLTNTVEVSESVSFSQYQTIKRIYKFRNRNLSGSKLNADLSYDYYFDIISPRADSEVKNLRFDSKHIMLFSRSPIEDFAAVFVANASLKNWMAENGEDEKLKTSVEEFVTNGNIGFKRVSGGYEVVDALNTYITNQTAKDVDDTDIIERHEMTASEIKSMAEWDQDVADNVIKDLGNKSFKSTDMTTPVSTTTKKYEIFEFTGEVSEKEFNAVRGIAGGNENKYFIAKVITAGLKDSGLAQEQDYVLFAEELDGSISEHYIYAHRGRYEGRFWRVGMYELLFDHQIRANQIGNDLARGMEWASKVIFRSEDSRVLQNIRADLDNGDVIIAKDLSQVDVRLENMDQLIADWNRLMTDADRVSGSFEIVRGENLPSGTPFRLGALLDQNAGMMFTLLRQKLSLPYKRVFREWVLPDLVKDLKGKDVFTLVGDTEVLEELRKIMVERWYLENLVKIGPHTKEVGDAIKDEKLEELAKIDPVIENSKEIWKGVLPRIFVTITGENSDLADQVTDLVNLVKLEEDPLRRAWIMDQIYRIRNIPIPPKPEVQPAPQMAVGGAVSGANAPVTAPTPKIATNSGGSSKTPIE